MLSTCMLAALLGALSADAKPATPTLADKWHADYSDALAETKQADQPLLVVMDDEEHPLDAELLNAAETGSYALCHIDASTEYGKKVAEGFKATTFPHTVIIDKSGSAILRRIGAEVTADEWTTALKTHADGERTGRTSYTAAKPVISAPTTTATTATATPVTTFAPTVQPTISYPSAAPAQPYCPSCQLRNRY